jgi:glycosyltransferase involved in cell wall biosynthesis
MNNSSIYIIIPTFNEASAVIRQTIQPLLTNNYTVVLIDDGSQRDVLSELCDLPVICLRHSVNLGQGAALQTGMEFAKREGASYVVHFDADGQHPVDGLQQLLQPLQEGLVDVALGSRFLRESDISNIPLMRRMVLLLARTINGLFTGLWLSDAHNGFRALNRKAIEVIHLSENRQAHATEILYQIRYNSLRIVEVPSCITYTEYSMAKGQSSMNALSIFVDLLLNKLFK